MQAGGHRLCWTHHQRRPHLKFVTVSQRMLWAVAGIVDMLTLAAGDKSDKVQRRAMAALGELLFYVAMQSDDDAVAAASPSATPATPDVNGAPRCMVHARRNVQVRRCAGSVGHVLGLRHDAGTGLLCTH